MPAARMATFLASMSPPRWRGPGFASLLLLALAATGPATAAPYVPADDKLVLERLPARPGDPETRAIRELRRRIQAEPGKLEIAVELAQRYYRSALRQGDPRYVGYAQAALAPWWESPDPPPDVRVLRAQLAQYRHEFDAALSDLTSVLEADPGRLDARSYRAVILMVLARYGEARRDCAELEARAEGLVTSACSATVDSLNGRAAQGYEVLKAALERHPEARPEARLWAWTRRAEAALRLGRVQDAEAAFRQALALGISDAYLLAAYAEFLLDQKRSREVVDLLQDQTRNDVLLLRLAVAEKRLGLPAAAEHQAALQARIDAARLRGDKLHLSDEAWFELEFRARPEEAVRLARENWDSGQHEPSDARILMEAALAAGRPDLAEPARRWFADNRVEDPVLAGLALRLREPRP